VVRFNVDAPSVQQERRMERMAYAMGLGDIAGADAAAQAVAQAITAMNARLGLPTGLAALGVERAWFDKIIAGAMADHCHKTNPRLASEGDYREMLKASM
jgi:alcohol dehydrogenase class IV